MKPYKKYLSIRHWLAFLRRQPVHMQHVYAVAFSGIITALLGAFILYYDYGFWHDRYSAKDVTVVEKKDTKEVETISPGEMMNGFLKEVGMRMQELKNTKTTVLEGKEVYTKEESSSTESQTGPSNE